MAHHKWLMLAALGMMGCNAGSSKETDSGWAPSNVEYETDSDGEHSEDSDTDEVRADYWSLSAQAVVTSQELDTQESLLVLSTWSSEDLSEPTCVERVRIRTSTRLTPPDDVYGWWELTLGSTVVDDEPGDTGDTADTGKTADTGATGDSGDADTAAGRSAPEPDSGDTADTGLPVRDPCPFVDFDTITVGMGALDTQLLPAMNAADLDEDLPVHGLYLMQEGDEQLYVFGIAGTSAQLAGEGDSPTGPDVPDGSYLWVPLYLFPT